MKKAAIIFLFLFSFIKPVYSVNFLEISEVYIEGTGNNKYEARIKALEEGMQRAFLMVADQMGLKSLDIKNPPYKVLKEIFIVTKNANEIETEESFSGTVTFSYEINHVNKLLLEYGDQAVKNKFYDYLIFPIFKQKKVLNLWNSNQDWNKKWFKLHDILRDSKLYYPDPTQVLIQEINPNNIFYLSYEDFLELFYGKLFKKVLIVVCEYFTDSSTGKAIMNVQYMVLSGEQARSVTEDVYPIESMSDITTTMNHGIINAIKKHGELSAENEKRVIKLLSEKRNHSTPIAEEEKPKRLILYLDAYDNQELKIVEDKLKTVPQIEEYEVKHETSTKYRIYITTRYSEFELSEGFYEKGLSFKVYGNIYKLIDIKEGS
jgi:hypothetical protein